MFWTRSLLCVVCAALCACGGADVSPDPAPVEPAAPLTPESTPAATYTKTSLVGKQAAWVLRVIKDGGKVDDATLKEHFTPETLSVLPVEQLKAVFEQLSMSFGPFKVIDVAMEKDEQVALLIESQNEKNRGTKMVMVLAVESKSPNKLIMLKFKPPKAPVGELAKSWKEIKVMMDTAASSTILSVSEIDPTSGSCSSVYNHKSSQAMPLGSAFKLYILAAAAKQVEQGTLKWTTKYPIKDTLKSLPSGTMQNQKAGEMFTLQDYAERMISMSDNTATDHMLSIVGRKSVEAMLDDTGNAQAHTKPFLMTQEMFKLKFLSGVNREAFANAGEAERRKILASLHTQPLPTIKQVMKLLKTPRNIRTIEWFASAKDMCALHAHFVQNASKPAYAGAFKAMAINNGGLKLNSEQWVYVGFKGGSETGVLYLSYLTRHKDGRWMSINLGWADEKKSINDAKLPVITQSVGRLLK